MIISLGWIELHSNYPPTPEEPGLLGLYAARRNLLIAKRGLIGGQVRLHVTAIKPSAGPTLWPPARKAPRSGPLSEVWLLALYCSTKTSKTIELNVIIDR